MTALLEREREVAELGEALEAARLGRGAVVLVQGPAGRRILRMHARLVRMRLGQLGWYRDFPPVSVEESPLAMGMAMGRLLRRHRRLNA